MNGKSICLCLLLGVAEVCAGYGVTKTHMGVEYTIPDGMVGSCVEESVKSSIERGLAHKDETPKETVSRIQSEKQTAVDNAVRYAEENQKTAQQAYVSALVANGQAERQVEVAQSALDNALESGVAIDSQEYKQLEEALLSAREKQVSTEADLETKTKNFSSANEALSLATREKEIHDARRKAEEATILRIIGEDAYICQNLETLMQQETVEKRMGFYELLKNPDGKAIVIAEIKKSPAYVSYLEEHVDLNLLAGYTPPSQIGDPVLLQTGSYYLNDVDMQICYGLDTFYITRSYLSGLHNRGSFGNGWKSSFDTCIIRPTEKSYGFICDEIHRQIDSYPAMQAQLSSMEELVSDAMDAYARLDISKQYLSERLKSMEQLAFINHQNENYNRYVSEFNVGYTTGLDLTSLCYISDDGSAGVFARNENLNRWELISDSANPVALIYENEKSMQYYYELQRPDGSTRFFDIWGRISKAVDCYDNALDFCYGEDCRFFDSVCQNGKKLLSVERNAKGFVTVIYNHVTNDEYTYHYIDDKLITVLHGIESVSYEYNANHDLVRISKSDGSYIEIAYGIYGSEKRYRVVSVQNEEGFKEYFDYDLDNNKVYFTNSDGFLTSYSLFKGNLVSEICYADGETITWEYDAFLRMVSRTDSFGTIHYSYDDNGNLTEVLYPDGSTEQWIYSDLPRRLSSCIDRDGICTEYIYDSHGMCSAVFRDNNLISEFQRNEWGGVCFSRGIGGERRYVYDENYNIVYDGTALLQYDNDNRISSIDTGFNQRMYRYSSENTKIVKEFTDNDVCTVVVSNSRGDIIEASKIDLKTGYCHSEFYEYDARHLVTKIFSGDGENEDIAKVSCLCSADFSYSPSGLLLQKTLWNYGSAAQHDGPGICYLYDYNCLGEVVSCKIFFIDYLGNKLSDDIEYTYTYYFKNNNKYTDLHVNGAFIATYCSNSLGNVISVSDSEGRQMLFDYSPGGKLLRQRNVYGGWEEYSHDSATENLSTVIRNGIILKSFEYDTYGRVSCVEDENFRTYYDYSTAEDFTITTKRNSLGCEIIKTDKSSRVVYNQLITADGDILHDSSISFDDKNRSACYSDILGNDCVILQDMWGNDISSSDSKYTSLYNANGKEVSRWYRLLDGSLELYCLYSYNALGLLSKILFADGSSRDYYYDVCGNLIRFDRNGNRMWSGEYTPTGKLKSEQGMLIPRREYEYDGSGNLTAVMECGIVVCRYIYSSDMRTVICEDANGNRSVVFYDEFGSITSRIDRLGDEERFSENQQNKASCFVDKNGNQRMSLLDRDRGGLTVYYESGRRDSLVFNIDGSILQGEIYSKGNRCSVEYDYDAAGRIISSKSDEKTVHYEYDTHSRLVALYVDGEVFLYEYNEDGKLCSVGTDTCRLYYSYMDDGRLVRVSNDFGLVTEYAYDELDRPYSLISKNSYGDVLFAELTSYAVDGHIEFELSYTDEHLTMTAYSYDDFGRLQSMIRSVDSEFLERVEEVFADYGDIPSLVPLTGTYQIPKSYESSVADFLRQIGKTYLSLELKWCEQYFYDNNGNRTQCISPAGTVCYIYDAENRLISSFMRDGASIEYIYDKNGNLIQKNSLYKSVVLTYTEDNRLETYNSIDRLTGKETGISFSYDVFGRVIKRIYTDGRVVHSVYDRMSFRKLMEWEECSVENTMSENGIRYRKINDMSENTGFKKCSFIYANNFLVGQINDGISLFPVVDKKGSVRCVFDSFSAFQFSCDYTAFGIPLRRMHGSGSLDFNHLYCGKQYDEVLEVYDYGYRLYDPGIARFITEDPFRDSLNWYVYCNNNPIDFMDDLGLEVRIVVDMNNMTLEAQYIVNGEVLMAINSDNGNRDPFTSPITTAVVSGDTREKTDMSRAQSYGGDLWTLPSKFPEGTWDIWVDYNKTGIESYGTDWIRSNATQQESIVKATDKRTITEYTDRTFTGSGYCIHMTSTSNTNGCVGIHDSYILDTLVQMLRLNAAAGETTAKLEIKYTCQYDDNSVNFYSRSGGVTQPGVSECAK